MTFTSPYAPVEIPDTTLYDYIFGTLTDDELSRPAVTDGAMSFTYGELRDAIDAFAGALAAREVKPGDVVALHCPNAPAFVIAFHGILRAGATATTINSLYGPAEIASQLRDSGAGTYVTVSALLPGALGGCAEVGLPTERIIVLDPTEGYTSLLDLLGEGHPAPDVELDAAEALAVLPYSSGTTGKAKGVMLTHRNLVANIAQTRGTIVISPDQTALAVLPFFHIYGMNVIMALPLVARARIVTMPRFDLQQFLQLTQDEKVNVLFIAPPMAVALSKHPMVADYDLSSVELVTSGAAPLDEELGKALVARIPSKLIQGYGMTELSPVSHSTPFDDPEMSYGSIGVAIPGIEFRVVDVETLEDVPFDAGSPRATSGELWIKGPNVMKGYLGNPQATEETITPEGWLRTGDIVEIGAKEELYVVDRLKELIKYKGYQVPPAELEALLLTHPAIADSAVVAFPDEEGGEVPRAFVVLQEGASATAEEIMEFVAGKVAPHKKIRLVDFIDVIPKSASGKILRKDLRGVPRPA